VKFHSLLSVLPGSLKGIITSPRGTSCGTIKFPDGRASRTADRSPAPGGADSAVYSELTGLGREGPGASPVAHRGEPLPLQGSPISVAPGLDRPP